MRGYGDNRFEAHGDMAGYHWVIGLLLVILIVAGIAMLFLRGPLRSCRWHHAPSPPPPVPGAGRHDLHYNDAAVAAARLRYAHGELSREDFLRISADLGAPTP